MLPAAGYLVIAWQADNPGVWLAHCQYVIFFFFSAERLSLFFLSDTFDFSFLFFKFFFVQMERLTDGFLFSQHWVAYG